MFAVGGDAIVLNGIGFAGTRLWEVPDLGFRDLIDWRDESGDEMKPPSAERDAQKKEQNEKIFRRELIRLERALETLESLRQLQSVLLSVLLVHYPPTSVDLDDTEVTELIESYAIDHVVFGHLHALRVGSTDLFGKRGEVSYHLTSCDYLGMAPKFIAEVT